MERAPLRAPAPPSPRTHYDADMSAHYDADFDAIFGGSEERGDVPFFRALVAATSGPVCEVGAHRAGARQHDRPVLHQQVVAGHVLEGPSVHSWRLAPG